jgi:Leucine-rich repeat (LRR) protein
MIMNFDTYSCVARKLISLPRSVLSENLLYGQLPNELSALPNLLVLSVYRREKSGPRLFGTLPSLDKLPQLVDLLLQGNEIQGPIPHDFLSASRSVKNIDLSSNLLTGEIPVDLVSIPSLTLLMTENYIEGLPSLFCDERDWMGGAVGSFGCNAILCPPGTASPAGRSTDASMQCENCTKPGIAPFYGSTTCDGPTNEREILVNFYYAVGGDSWYRHDFWGSTADICDWYGVACIDDRVVEINLRANNLNGKPGPDLFYLRDLQILWLYSNPISFSFENIGSATKLQDLRLDSTNLQSLYGIGAASSLISFDARFAPIRGTIPEDILGLTNLRSLSLGDNELSGSLPTSFSSLRYLVHISANSNRLTGRLPAFDDLHFLRYIDVSNNLLTGPISRRFLDKIPIDASPWIKVSRNQLSGVIPEEFDRFDEMTLYSTDNGILGLPLTLCDNDDWNRGHVGEYGCDAIMCKPGSFSKYGRTTPYKRCKKCLTALHYGSTSCRDETSSSTRLPYNMLPGLIVSVAATVWLLF